MVVSGELSMTRVFPVVAALLELEAELELELEHAPSPTASKQAVTAAKSHLILRNLLITIVLLFGVLGYGLTSRVPTSLRPGDELR
jgi:hypothetical protein